MYPFRAFALAGTLLLASGCVRESVTVRVNPDGSGTITVERSMKSWAVEEGRRNNVKAAWLTEEDARARAGKIGEGVTFVSAEKTGAEGWTGVKATYAFKEVTKLRVHVGDNREGGAAFRLADQPGGRKLLAVTLASKPPEHRDDGGQGIRKEAVLALLDGLKIQLTVEVSGKIEKTNSPHVNGSAVAVYEIDFNELMAEEIRLRKLAAREPATPEEARETIRALRTLQVWSGDGRFSTEERLNSYRGVKGAKFSPPELTIEFSPR